MERTTFQRLAERLRGPQQGASLAFTVPAERYRDPAWCEREKAALFGGPRIVAASSELSPGSVRTVDRDGLAALVIRDADGTVHAFANACRHRGTRLVDAPCEAKALVCPYHGWTYDLAGRLIHVPHEQTFAIDCTSRGLRELEVTERHGLVWLGPGAATFARELDADLAALALDRHVVWKRATTTRRCNWKLVIEAFLDGYHIRVLHRDSIYRFFLDATSVAETAGPHIRALTGRRALRDAPADLSGADLRLLATPSYLVFPSTVIVVHPDFVSLLTMTPRAPDATEWEHVMLVPRGRVGDADHWDRSWALIEDAVFQREDLWVCEQIQRSIMAGATDELLFGALEEAVPWFHAAIDAAVTGSGAQRH